MNRTPTIGPWSTIVVIVGLLAAGLTMQLALIRPQLAEVNRLGVARARLRSQIAEVEADRLQTRRLLEYFHQQGATAGEGALAVADPATFLAEVLDQSGLSRLELGAEVTSTEALVRRSRYRLRALGSYQNICNFARRLEQGPRLASMDDFTVESIVGSCNLELRASVCVFDPVGNP